MAVRRGYDGIGSTNQRVDIRNGLLSKRGQAGFCVLLRGMGHCLLMIFIALLLVG
jgi:hypothetical protein